MNYPKRLIEVDLPIRRISRHARLEKKSAGHGHLTTLHIWWARRPLAACRAVICATLWPDPADEDCPKSFVDTVRKEMLAWTSHERQLLLSDDSRPRFDAARKNSHCFNDPMELRHALLDFIADFSDENNSTVREYLDTSHILTQTAHQVLGGLPSTLPLVVDPFAGGGAIPMESARIGADAYGTDLNPVAVLLNRVLLKSLPQASHLLPDLLQEWGMKIRDELIEELGDVYPHDVNGPLPVAYIWARTVLCEGPNCGARIPLIRSLWLQKKGKNKAALAIIADKQARRVSFQVLQNPNQVGEGTVRRGAVTCPCCGYTTAVTSVRKQLIQSQGGTRNSQCVAIISSQPGIPGRLFSTATEREREAIEKVEALQLKKDEQYLKVEGGLPLDEELPLMSGVFNAPLYGITSWRLLYSPRQLILLLRLADKIAELGERDEIRRLPVELSSALITCLGLVHSKLADLANSLCNWEPNVPTVQHLFGRQSIQMSWDYAEGNILGSSRGSWLLCLQSLVKVIRSNTSLWRSGEARRCDAAVHFLPDNIASAIITDPPYYNAVPYADLSDFFYTWLRRTVRKQHPDLFESPLAPKAEEICEMSGWDERRYKHKDKAWFEVKMTEALGEARRLLAPNGIGVVVFAHKSTAGWEAMLQAIINAGWTIISSWPIDTELPTRLRGMNSAALASSVHLVCRPRENPDGSLRTADIGDWRDVLQELPRRIHDWMPRLADEGVVGADAIFACLGPALEIFSRYARVEKASGETVTLKEYLEQVWAAVAKEALAQVFKGADTVGFEPDARLTAMWLWTLNAGASPSPQPSPSGGEGEEPDDEEDAGKGAKAKGGFVLEYDAARKIAQGLGANLEDLTHIIEVSGESARLLPVSERTRYLFGKDEAQAPAPRSKKKAPQLDLFAELSQGNNSEAAWGEKTVQRVGETTLDRIHQAMILFAAGRGEALKRFLVEDGAGRDGRFWKLAQALSALYPASSSEKRWVDGVLARKKGLGL